MLLQVILHCTGFYKTFSLWYLSTDKHQLSDSISIYCIFFHSPSVLIALQTAEDILLSRSVHLMCVLCLYESRESGKSMHCLQGGPAAPGGGTCLLDREKQGCCSQSSLGTSLADVSLRLVEVRQQELEKRRQLQELSPGRGFPTLLRSPALRCCSLPSPGTLSWSLLWGASTSGYKTWDLPYIKKIKFWNSLSVQLPRSRLPLQTMWSGLDLSSAPQNCVCPLSGVCAHFPPLSFFFLFPSCF